jgi:aryl-alcohol dehydrogenase-like predicted oxidoreductase
LPWCRERNLPVMAYSPIEQGRLLGHRELQHLRSSRRLRLLELGYKRVYLILDNIEMPVHA